MMGWTTSVGLDRDSDVRGHELGEGPRSSIGLRTSLKDGERGRHCTVRFGWHLSMVSDEVLSSR